LQINITTVAFFDEVKPGSEYFPDIVSGKEKLGAIVPKANMEDGVNDIVYSSLINAGL